MKASWKRMVKNRRHAFSLVEVTLALGIVTVAILSTIGLLTIGLEMNRDSVARTGAASVAREVIGDLQMLDDWDQPSPRLEVTPNSPGGSPRTFYVLPDGTYRPAASVSAQERTAAAYRVDLSFNPPSLHVVVSWPTGAAGDGQWPRSGSSIYEVVSGLGSLSTP